MKKTVFFIGMIIVFLISTSSCTTDGYDKEMEQTIIHTDETTTDPIVIPKRD